jgi:26S proteasome regulatory subunit T5
MSSAPPSEPPSDPPAGNNVQKPDAPQQPEASPALGQDGVEMDTTPDQPAEETWDDIPEEIKALTTEEILTRIRLIDNDIKVRRLHLAIHPPELNYRVLCPGDAGHEV